jgi:hypothetical protein
VKHFINDMKQLATTGSCREFSEAVSSGRPARDAGIKCLVGLAASAASILMSAWLIRKAEERVT